jgi:hypothetical protein
MKRKPFGEVFEGKKIGEGIPQVTLRRLTSEEEQKYDVFPSQNVGIFHGADPIAFVDFDDLFDADGNRFYND